MVEISFDGGPVLGTVNILIGALVLVIALQVINNIFGGGYRPIIDREKKQDKQLTIKPSIIANSKPFKDEKPKKKELVIKGKNGKVPKIVIDNLKDEKDKKKRFGLF